MVYKVAIFTRNDSFLPPILRELSTRDCIVKRWIHSTDNETFNMTHMYDLMKWADTAFFEFLNEPLPMASYLSEETRIVARLLGIEVYAPQMKIINWPRVNLILPPPQALRFQREASQAKPASISVLSLGVNPEPAQTPKDQFGYNIAIVAFTPLPRKRLYTTMESFVDLLLQSKKSWTLNIRGASTTGFRDQEAFEYLKFMKEFETTASQLIPDISQRIVFHPYLEPDEYEQFLRGTDIIISNSMQEGYHISVLEAMSHGAYPLVHRWMGADQIFPEKYLFWTQRELVDKILAWDALPIKGPVSVQDPVRNTKFIESLHVQKYVRENHNEKDCAKKIVDVIMGVS